MIREANLDGLVGPTHHYGGLAHGNVASKQNALTISNPRKAALQGLDKMKLLHELGVPQFILPPPERPNPAFYDPLITDLAELSVIYSASYMWRANAAIVTPSSDSGGQVHFTAANLLSHRHRAQECKETEALLARIFADKTHFYHHAPLPEEPRFSDEGAANHMRLAASHEAPGIHIFVYGRDVDNPKAHQPVHFQPRATRQAMERIAEYHHLSSARCVFVQQHPDAVDAGVFHNDVIAMNNERLLILHEKAWVHQAETLAHCRKLLPELIVLEVKDREIPLALAVSTYLFNSQLVTLKDGSMALIAPSECQDEPRVAQWIDSLIGDSHNPVGSVHYLNLRESMKNGGGPACLRLRALLTEAELKAANQRFLYTPDVHAQLAEIIELYYRDYLKLEDLRDPELAREARVAQLEILRIFT